MEDVQGAPLIAAKHSWDREQEVGGLCIKGIFCESRGSCDKAASKSHLHCWEGGVLKDPFPGSSGEVTVVGINGLRFGPVPHDSETGGTGRGWEKLRFGVLQRCRDCPSYPNGT